MNKYYAIPIIAVIVISISLVWYVSNDYQKYEDSNKDTEQPVEKEDVEDNSVIPEDDDDYTDHEGESYDFETVAEMLAEYLAEDGYSEEEIEAMIENDPDMVYEYAADAGITILDN